MAFCVDLGQELAGDAMDMAGDTKRGSRFIALLKGRPFALRIAVALWGRVILLSFLPALLGWLGTSYRISILISDGLLAFFSIRLLQSQSSETGRRAMRGAYLGATLGMMAFLIANSSVRRCARSFPRVAGARQHLARVQALRGRKPWLYLLLKLLSKTCVWNSPILP